MAIHSKRSCNYLKPLNIHINKIADSRIQIEKPILRIEGIGHKENPKENIINKLTKFSKKEWKSKYDQLLNKYGDANIKIECAAKMLQNKTAKKGNSVISYFQPKLLEDDGTITIGYAIRYNNTLESVILTSDLDEPQ